MKFLGDIEPESGSLSKSSDMDDLQPIDRLHVGLIDTYNTPDCHLMSTDLRYSTTEGTLGN